MRRRLRIADDSTITRNGDVGVRNDARTQKGISLVPAGIVEIMLFVSFVLLCVMRASQIPRAHDSAVVATAVRSCRRLSSAQGSTTTAIPAADRGSQAGSDARLIDAAASGDSGLVRELVADKATDVNAGAESGMTALISASLYGRLSVVQLLFAAGAGPDVTDNDGTTPLMVASQEGHRDVAELLLDRGASVDKQDNRGATALMIAAAANRIEVVNLLLERGADVRAAAGDGSNALMAAAFGGHAEVVNTLVAKHSDLGVHDPQSRTILMAAAMGGNLIVVKTLLAAGADVNAVDADGDTALAYA